MIEIWVMRQSGHFSLTCDRDRFPVCRSSVGRLCHCSRSTQCINPSNAYSVLLGCIACFEIFPTGNTACGLITGLVFPEFRLLGGIAWTGTLLGSNLLRLTYNNYIAIIEVMGFNCK